MGRVAIGIAGAVAGVGIALASGFTALPALLAAGSMGFSVGTTAGNLLFPDPAPQVTQEGARLNDLNITASTYGVVIPFGFGKFRMAGNIIWSKPIEEHKNVTHSRQGGKGGGGAKGGAKVTQTTYSYTVSFAVGLCKGPADRVLRMWANGTLIYDITTGQDVVRRNGLKFRFYPGNETQLPDSLIEADKGAGNVPAHRGLCYVVFEDLDLADFGQRMPNITVELAFQSTFVESSVTMTPTTPTTLGRWSNGSNQKLAINPLTLRGYIWGEQPTGLAEFDLSSMQVLKEQTLGVALSDASYNTFTILFYNTLVIGHNQMLYAALGTEIAAINPASLLKITDPITVPSRAFGNNIDLMVPLALLGPDGLRQYLVCRNRVLQKELFVLDATNWEWLGINVNSAAGGSIFVGGCKALAVGRPDQGIGEAWCVGVVPGSGFDGYGDTLYIERIYVNLEPDVNLSGPIIRSVPNIQTMATIDFTEVQASGGAGWESDYNSTYDAIYDETDNGLIITAPIIPSGGGAPRYFVFKWTPDAGIIWTYETGKFLFGGGFLSKVSGTTWARFFGNDMIVLNAATGDVIQTHTWAFNDAPNVNGSNAFWSEGAALIAVPNVAGGINGRGIAKWFVERADGDDASVDQIFERICDEAGLEAGDVDVSALASLSLNGFMVSQRTTAADILRPIATLFQIDAIERDYGIAFQPRGGAVVATIEEDDLIRGSTEGTGGEPYLEARAKEEDLPWKFTLSFTDSGGDYRVSTQTKQRVRLPTPTQYSTQQVDLQIAAAMTPDLARQQAEVMLYSAWTARHTIDVMLPPEFAWLDPADPISITLNSGLTGRFRMGPAQLGVDFSSQTRWIAEEEAQYVSTVEGAEMLGIPAQTIGTVSPSALFLLDVPLLRDIDDAFASGFRAYWAASSYGLPGWRGALLQESTDATSWGDSGITVTDAAWGYLEEALPDAVNIFHTAFDQSVTVAMVNGGDTLESVSELQLANGYNAAAVYKANGEIEIIQFLSVTALGNNRYLLEGLNRGQRGTDTMASDHAVGERILMLDPAVLEGLLVPINQYQQRDFFRAVTAGIAAGAAIQEVQVWHGRDKMPWAPVDVQAVWSGSPAADILLSWTRRNRTNAGLHDDDGDIPLSEDSEEYEVDVFASDGTTRLRTITGITTNSVLYTASEIASDFGSPPPDTLHVAVYQLSATVGRGFGRVDELEVA